jgi:hypothetical protein
VSEPIIIREDKREGVIFTLVLPSTWLVRVRWPKLAMTWWLLKMAWQGRQQGAKHG